MKGHVVEAVMHIEEAKNQLFHTTFKLIGANKDIALLKVCTGILTFKTGLSRMQKAAYHCSINSMDGQVGRVNGKGWRVNCFK
jgi:hypothetical protein